ncbi:MULTISPECIES: TrgA family protein [unclassified Ruegeria]|uniref:TrgA family protein n=1 Tax=unclassified Ruegeria TaxID=2625375 RepID=UPI0014914564|nr:MULTISPECIES: TrgA family protein [unclassified Ruegeria]NOC44895.1 TrgA family protein [Ruegeria sp. HKCCD7559]NOD83621.1 TrgA family protein [Ruegeria sp. HKCCD6119]
MPTASRLVAAVCLVVLAFLVSGMVIENGEEGKDYGYFTYVNMALGAICGWKIMGKRAGRGWTAGINNGLTGVASLIFWALFVQGCYRMFDLAMRNRYGGPFEAVMAIFSIGIDYGKQLIYPEILVTLAIGAVVAGLATEQASRKWR